MKRIFMVSLVGAMLLSISTMASTDKYRISDESVEAVFTSSTLISSDVSSAVSFSTLGTDAVLAEKNAWVAFALAFVVGWTGAHRVYMGSKPILILGYIVTCGGIFGIVPFIDWIVILINNEDISKYIGNNKFFMW
jgi:TM2 domain-containing membrane protein YozV